MAEASTADQPNRHEVFTIMHHIESASTPPLRQADTHNVSRMVYIYDTVERATQHARRYAQERCYTLGLTKSAAEDGHWHDHSDALLGWGWRILVMAPGKTVDGLYHPGEMKQKELMWVERQWICVGV
ncbi:hypothetical protein LTR78_002195 [Recurvomyces mirabilis]|uniref:Uncharacterized protein n=1 Tax=Recurvomyces mirabilis TaxID=574656 RepID=A0AAE0WTX9_9PEZI|nr:hypothetical protein LTR78_002195 [Recurvomyces mirabilis]KAK5160651.1 hypothetical protein LTS14_001663 [Recurvomyces mirabilis]